MSISEQFQFRNDSFQSDIVSSDIGITDVDVGCRISPTLRSMSMPTYTLSIGRWYGSPIAAFTSISLSKSFQPDQAVGGRGPALDRVLEYIYVHM